MGNILQHVRSQCSRLRGNDGSGRIPRVLKGGGSGICSLAVVLLLALGVSPAVRAEEMPPRDVVVYGASAGGVMAAIAAANEGADVVLLANTRHVGGLVTGGLSQTDFGKKYVVGGMAREFFERLGKHYGEDIAWYFEPHVAKRTMMAWIEEAGVPVEYDKLAERVERDGGRIVRAVMTDGTAYTAKVFIDASYEGDLMARAGVSYTWGREGRDQYGEPLAGRLEYSPLHQFLVPVSAYGEDGEPLPLITGADPGPVGGGDRKMQAYNFRLCLTDDPENWLPLPAPDTYDPARFELLRRFLRAAPETAINELMIVSPMPNRKTDINNRGPVSTDYIGGNWDYPDAGYARRAEIWEDHRQYTLQLLHFLRNDPDVPVHVREGLSKFGLPKDEFADSGHWTPQLYVREARRMVGGFVMSQRDTKEERTKPDSIGMGSYNIDSHNVQRFINADGNAENEGDVQIGVDPYEIPYRVLLPARDECENLLVPVCCSASHVAYATLRMEPQYMIMGQAAGIAAALATRGGTAVHDVGIGELQERLRAGGAVLGMAQAIGSDYLDPGALSGVVMDNPDAELTGAWSRSASIHPFVGVDYAHEGAESGEEARARYTPQLAEAGQYEVRISYSPHPNRATNARVEIHAADGVHERRVNQREKAPKETAPFVSLGVFEFEETGGYVVIDAADSDGYVIADAVQWLPRPRFAMRVLPIAVQFSFGAVLCGIGVWAGISSGYLDLKLASERRLLYIIAAGFLGLLAVSILFTFWLPFVPGKEAL